MITSESVRLVLGTLAGTALLHNSLPAWAGQVHLRAEPPSVNESSGTFTQTSIDTITLTIANTVIQTIANTQTSTFTSSGDGQTVIQTIVSTNTGTFTSTSIMTLTNTSTQTITATSSSEGTRALSSSVQNCINQLNKNFARIAKAQGKEIRNCIQDGSRNRLRGQSMEGCFSADSRAKIARAREKTIRISAAECDEMPDFGPTDPNALNRAAVLGGVWLVHEMFGDDLSSAIIPSTNKHGSKCQQSLAHAVEKCREARLDEFTKCVKDGLKGRVVLPGAHLPFNDPNDLALCMDYDPKGRVGRACDPQGGGIEKAIRTKCATSDLSAAFPGCATSDADKVARCLDEIVACQVCRAVNEADRLSRDCDEFDDGAPNVSCP